MRSASLLGTTHSTFPEPAMAHVAVWICSIIVWDAEVRVPGPSNSLEVTVPIEQVPEPGARLGMRLHNHGFNSWRFVSVELHRH